MPEYIVNGIDAKNAPEPFFKFRWFSRGRQACKYSGQSIVLGVNVIQILGGSMTTETRCDLD